MDQLSLAPVSAVSDPFALMMNPEAVLRAVECSDRLARLQRRICRPLDKPLPLRGAAAEFDASVDAQPDEE
ncbi:hypothetical protein [Caldimonas sp. KR1-144]|uniref:hypothetical protein n=1 Tax=Caldimonas sp. KR1-144 TaxID=3400911 RepID=UPI003C05BEEB